MRREPAQNLMREEQVCKQRMQRIQQRQIREQEVKVRTANAHLAAEFTARFLRRLLGTDSACNEGAVEAFFKHLGRHEEVIHDALLDRQFRVQFTANGVEGAVTSNQHVEHTFELLDLRFQIPIRTFTTTQRRAALVRQNQVTAGATDFLVLERNHELAHHIREEHRVCVAEQENVVFRNLVQAIQHGGLTCILRSLYQRNALVCIAGDNFGCLVGRAIVANQNFQFVLGVIESQNILNLAFNHGFFIISRNQD